MAAALQISNGRGQLPNSIHLIRAANPSAMEFVEWQPPYRSAMGGGGCPTGYNSLGQPRELVEWAAAQPPNK